MIPSKCQISLLLSRIRSTDTEYAKEMLEVLFPFAIQYMELWKECIVLHKTLVENMNSPFDLLDKFNNNLQNINNLPFSSWLRRQTNFIRVKNRLIAHAIIDQNIDDILIQKVDARLNHYCVESLLANLIQFLHPNAENLRQTVFIPVKWKELVDNRMDELILMSRNFEREAEGHLFLSLVEKLKNSKGNVFNSGKPHEWQLRELMTKRMIQLLLDQPSLENETKTFHTDIALDLVGIFFASVGKRDDVIKIVEKIAQNLLDEKEFIKKQVLDLLNEYASNQS
jgi:hypothetical protein